MANKRYYWLKLKEDFFSEKYVKALRRLPQGDSLVIVYLKMQLKSLKTEGVINYEGILPNCIAELAMTIDEDENVVRLAVEALINFGAIERWENDTLYMAAMQELIGSETAVAERVRKHRALQCNTKTLLSNNDVTKRNTDIDIEKRDRDRDREKNINEQKKSSIHKNEAANTIRNYTPKAKKCQYLGEFEGLWKRYPNKKGKDKALNEYVKARDTGTSFEEVENGINKYLLEIEAKGTQKSYVKHGSTWFKNKCWLDEYDTMPEPKGSANNAIVGKYVKSDGSEYAEFD